MKIKTQLCLLYYKILPIYQVKDHTLYILISKRKGILLLIALDGILPHFSIEKTPYKK